MMEYSNPSFTDGDQGEEEMYKPIQNGGARKYPYPYMRDHDNSVHREADGVAISDLPGDLGASDLQLADTWSIKTDSSSSELSKEEKICHAIVGVIIAAGVLAGVVCVVMYFAVWRDTSQGTKEKYFFGNQTVICNENYTAPDQSNGTTSWLFQCPSNQCQTPEGGAIYGSCCVKGHCRCYGEGYNSYTCLPEIPGCHVLPHQSRVAAPPTTTFKTTQSVYSCLNLQPSSPREVHILAAYTSNSLLHQMQNSVEMRGITVNITREGNSSKQVVLALSSFEAVQWTVDVPVGVNVSEILLFSPNMYSTVVPARHGSADSPKLPLVAIFRQPYGYGIDSEGYGSTPALLESVEEETQTKITSFTGSSVVDRFELTVGLM